MSEPFRSDLEAARQRIEQLEAEHDERVGELEEENRRLRQRLIDRDRPPAHKPSAARVVLPVAMILFGVSLGAGMFVARRSRPAMDAPLPPPTPMQELPADPFARDEVDFDRRAAADALGGVRVQDCAIPGGPHGAGHAKITFAPSGVVVKAEVDQPPYARTAVGRCIEERYRGARVPAFSGPPTTVGKSFDLE